MEKSTVIGIEGTNESGTEVTNGIEEAEGTKRTEARRLCRNNYKSYFLCTAEITVYNRSNVLTFILITLVPDANKSKNVGMQDYSFI